ncbi:diguanylate cyclase [Novosphingobium panipatense]|jgi:diguanylate cyclase (GGDEF)-like protein|uniref:diguanylate cyclase domain-containing protein n=1 Tax=Novosphingobium TaxID=165696 RepID=UPI000CDB1277|nr:diguanylate cyclase [Novosphingobium sp. HII-3]
MHAVRIIARPVLTALLCFVLSATMIKYLSFDENLASVWPVNAVVLAQILIAPRRQWPRFLLAGFIGITAGGILIRGVVLSSTAFGISNMIEAFVAASLLRGAMDPQGRLLHRDQSVVRFVVAAGFVAPACGGFLKAIVAMATLGSPIGASLLTKFTVDSLGLLIFTPFFYRLFSGDYLESLRTATGSERRDGALLHGTMLVVCLAVFSQNSHPLLFLTLVPLMLVAFRTGWRGVSVAMILLATIGVLATLAGRGPVSLSGRDMGGQLAFLQFFLAIVLALMMPVSAALAARRDLIERFRESEHALMLLAGRSAIVLLRFDREGVCTRAVGDAAALLGESVERLLGSHMGELAPSLGEPLFAAHLQVCREDADGRKAVTTEIERPGGRWVEAIFRVEHDQDGAISGSVATLMDVSARKAREGELARRAETDYLTGLPNRAGFLHRFETALATDGPLSVAFIDVDRFKVLNDELGHLAGDAVLVELARRFSHALRPGDLVARLGGDEFVVLLLSLDAAAALDVCRRLVESVSAAPVELPTGGLAEARISCGLVHRMPGQSGVELLNRADQALYEAKRSGRNQLIAA